MNALAEQKISYSRILTMTESELLAWLSISSEKQIEDYLKQFEALEYYEICAVIRDYLKLIYE